MSDDDVQRWIDASELSCATLEADARAVLAAWSEPLADEVPDVWDGLASRIRAHENPVQVSVQCTYCHDGLARPEAVYCAACLAPHHADCFAEHGACSALGCGETQVVRAANAPRRRRGWHRWGGVVLGAALAGGVAAWSLSATPEAERVEQQAAVSFEEQELGVPPGIPADLPVNSRWAEGRVRNETPDSPRRYWGMNTGPNEGIFVSRGTHSTEGSGRPAPELAEVDQVNTPLTPYDAAGWLRALSALPDPFERQFAPGARVGALEELLWVTRFTAKQPLVLLLDARLAERKVRPLLARPALEEGWNHVVAQVPEASLTGVDVVPAAGTKTRHVVVALPADPSLPKPSHLLYCHSADVRTALQVVAEHASQNIILEESLRGTVNVEVSLEEPLQAIHAILEAHGERFQVQQFSGEPLRVVSLATINSQLETRVFVLKNLDAAEGEALAGLAQRAARKVTQYALVEYDELTNALIVTAPTPSLEELKDLLETLEAYAEGATPREELEPEEETDSGSSSAFR